MPESESLCPDDPEKPPLADAIAAIRAAGGDAWDEIGDVEAYLGGDQAPDPHADKAARLDAMLSRIFESSRLVREKHADYEAKNKLSKAAKQAWEAAAEEHSDLEAELERERNDPATPGPLFEQPAAIQNVEDLWREVSIRVALEGPPVGVIVSMNEAGIFTMGDLADWTAAGKRLTDIPGVGEAKAQQIHDAEADFWARWRAEQGPGETDPVVEAIIGSFAHNASAAELDGDLAPPLPGESDGPEESTESEGETVPMGDPSGRSKRRTRRGPA